MKNKGVFYALGAYFLWGVLPIFWKLLNGVPSFQTFSYRVISSFLFLLLVLGVRQEWGAFKKAVLNRKAMLLYTLTGVLLGINWLVFIWAVNTDHILESSLGYFITPLVIVALGVIFLGEKLRPWQWVPVGMAALGVVYLTVQLRTPPWIALALAVSFGLYGLLKKIAPAGGLYSMTIEMGALLLPALGYLIFLGIRGQGVLGSASPNTLLLLAATGAITVIPILLFTAAARSTPLSLIGILQYLNPTLQFLVGALVYGEPVGSTKLIGYGMVWAALLVFWLEDALQRRKTNAETKTAQS